MRFSRLFAIAFLSCVSICFTVARYNWAADTAVEEKKETKNSAVVPAFHAGTEAKHERINARAKQGGVDLLFIGDSITDNWQGPGKQVWEKYYGNRKAMNAGIGGD